MFSFFKKKPDEQKFGRQNYVNDLTNFGTDPKHWILSLSAVYLEYQAIDIENDSACHDHLVFFNTADLSTYDIELLKCSLEHDSPESLAKSIESLRNCFPYHWEEELYALMSVATDEEANEIIYQLYPDDESERDLLFYIWQNKDDYQHGFHYRLGFIIDCMWQVRLAACLELIDENTAWKHLYSLTELAKPVLTIFDNWQEFNENQRLYCEISDTCPPVSG